VLRISRRAWAALRGRARFITRHRQAYMTRGRMLCDTVNQRETLRISTLFAGAAAMKRDPHAARDAAGRAMTGEDGPSAPFPRALNADTPSVTRSPMSREASPLAAKSVRSSTEVRVVQRPRKAFAGRASAWGELISKNRESVGRRRLPRNQRGLYSRLGCGKTNCSVFGAEAWRKEKKHYGRLAANLDRSRPARGEGVDPLPHAVRRSGLIAVVTLDLMSGPRRGRERGRQWGNHDRSKSR
jgi:hypothetical protein